MEALELKDFAIVDELRIELTPGLNVLTGETGAGKSILIDALALLVGERADTSMVRSGRGSALIQGLFRDAPLTSASRRLLAAGRSSARIDGEVVTIGELAQRGGELVAIHGQHASVALLDPGEQRRQLDRLLDPEAQAALTSYRRAYGEYSAARDELETLRAAARERARRLDVLRFQLDEIDAAKLRSGEEQKLLESAESLRHGERIVQGAGRALAALSDADDSIVDRLAAATRDLEGAARFHRGLAPLAEELAEALTGLQATSAEIERFLGDFEVEPGALERIEGRIARLEALKRKYGDSVDAILEYRAETAVELARLEGAEADEGRLQERLGALEDELTRLAGMLHEARLRVAAELSAQVGGGLGELGMPNGRFEVVLEPTTGFTSHGLDRVAFRFSANLGEPLAELEKVASGGELSRLMLALNVVTGSELPTLAFDEVDAGIGGSAARAVGVLLKRLAERHQVLVVTHLPQVAAFADAQFHVEKREHGGRTVTRVTRLEPHERELELARMLSGAVTEASLGNARELIAEAQAGS